MDGFEAEGWLKAVRRLRMGTLEPDDCPEPLRHLVTTVGLGPVCDYLASWVTGRVADRRRVEVLSRYFGLVRLPEDLAAIAVSLRPARRAEGGCDRGERISTRQVQHLIRSAIDQMGPPPETHLPSSSTRSGSPRWCDPFPLLRATPILAEMRTLLWAWAQIPEQANSAGPALLLYEQEHGLRPAAVAVTSRVQRQRFRRLAWSTLQVAAHRAQVATSPLHPEAIPVIQRTAGSGLLAILETHPSSPDPTRIGPLAMLLAYPPHLVPIDLVIEALDSARLAVRECLPHAPVTVSVVLDAIRLIGEARGPGFVPPQVISKGLTLSTILSKQHSELAGIPVADATLQQTEKLICDGGSKEANDVVIVDTLRTAQEMTELSLALGMPTLAWRSARRFHNYLSRYGDPEHHFEPNGWLHEVLLTYSRSASALAWAGRNPVPWLERATQDAELSAALVFDTRQLPVTWGVAAMAQRIEVDLDRISLGVDTRRARVLADVQSRLVHAHMELDGAPDTTDMYYKTARLAVELATWRAATIGGDPGCASAARADALAASGPWTTVAHEQRIRALESRTAALLGHP